MNIVELKRTVERVGFSKVHLMHVDLSIGRSVSMTYFRQYFICNMLPLSTAFNHLSGCSIFFLSFFSVFALLYIKQRVFFFCTLALLYLHLTTYVRNVIECCILRVMLAMDFYPVRTYRNRQINGKCIHQSFG